MKAAVATEQGVRITEVPKPAPKANEVLVKVRAAALNRADIGQARGQKHGNAGGVGAVIGMEFAGEVEAVGAGVQGGFKSGDKVTCSGAGAWAEYAVSDWGRVNPVPRGMDFTQAVTLPIALQTMHNAVVTNGRMTAGEAVLIQGASSGVGLMAMQIAKAKGARIVIGTSTHAGRRAKLGDYGADLALDTTHPSWPDQAYKAANAGVDLIVDQVSGGVMNGNMAACAILGRIVNVGRLGGQNGEFDYNLHALKRIDYIGVTFRTRSIEEVREINRLMRADIWPLVEDGTLRLPIDRTFPLEEVVAALEYMRANQHFGKIVLTV
ncbi:MAG: quinone oxidoreductase family protein [Stellaceae bacterium]